MKIPIIYKVESAFICLRVLINSYKDLNKLYKNIQTRVIIFYSEIAVFNHLNLMNNENWDLLHVYI